MCVRSASGFLRYLSPCHCGRSFLIWAKCERIENASSLQDMAKKTCLRRFRLCQPYCDNPRILSLPSPCHAQDHSHSGIVGGMGSRHVRYTKALLACDVLTLFVLWTSQGDKSRWQKWLRVACCMFDSRDICQVLSGKARGAGLEHFEFEGWEFLQCRVSLPVLYFHAPFASESDT